MPIYLAAAGVYSKTWPRLILSVLAAVPLFVTLGAVAKPDDQPNFTIDGYFYGLSKRSFEAR